MSKKCGIIVGLLSIVIVVMVYKFVIAGTSAPAADGRAAIVLSETEREFVLTEMRTFLESVQQITHGVVANDMNIVVAAANRVGIAAQHAAPGALIGKLPLEFKQLASATHGQFSQLAMDADQLGDREHTLSQLATLTESCVACHALFKIQTESATH